MAIAGSCKTENCTVKTTGICLLSHPEPAACPHFVAANDSKPVDDAEAKVKAEIESAALPPPSEPEKKPSRTFHSGSELGIVDASEIARREYVHLIGVLGCHNAGKTCFLSSLYLLASGGALPAEYQFRGCETFQAFEDRALGLREWTNGALQDQLVDHTVLDTRHPSLLHLEIRETEGERRAANLLLTDLPGEWTDKLVKAASYAETFRFLHRADGIILVVDGPLLLTNERHVELQKLRLFVERLVNDVKVDTRIPFVVLVSKADEIDMKMPPAAEDLRDHIESLGFPVTVELASAFSRTPEKVKSGFGVFEAIGTILSFQPSTAYPSPKEEDLGADARSWLRFKEEA